MNSKNNLAIALCISGGGTTMAEVIKACLSGELKANPALIISSRKDAGGIEKAKALNIPEDRIKVIPAKLFRENNEAAGETLIKTCQEHRIDLFCLCGFLPFTPENVIEEFKDNCFNQHPGALDPGHEDFGGQGMYGIRPHAASIYFKQGLRANEIWRRFYTEATTHRVTNKIDGGMILRREELEVEENQTPETLQQLLLPIEHRNVKNTIADFVNGTVKEYIRPARLIHQSEIDILNKSKEKAINNYP